MLRPVTIAPKILAAPQSANLANGYMPGWVPINLFFSLGAAFLSLAPSNAIGYYATGEEYGRGVPSPPD